MQLISGGEIIMLTITANLHCFPILTYTYGFLFQQQGCDFNSYIYRSTGVVTTIIVYSVFIYQCTINFVKVHLMYFYVSAIAVEVCVACSFTSYIKFRKEVLTS